MKRPTEQHMKSYTEADFHVWKTLFNRQVAFLRHHACREYLDCMEKIGFTENRIPDIRDINNYLQRTTGWKVVVVPNIVEEKDFFRLLYEKKFPVTVWLRTPGQLDYIEEPDMFHDVFGHVPLLAHRSYAGFFEQLAAIAVRNSDNAEIIKMLGRVYWFTIEFGLIRQQNENKIYGAGIISSYGEARHCLAPGTETRPYNLATIMNTPFNNMVIQNLYFYIASFEELFDSVVEAEKITARKTNMKITCGKQEL